MAGISPLQTKHIPTVFGLLILGIGLVGGILLVNNSTTNTFLPRASPDSAPKQAKITNVTDVSFTVSWITDGKTPGYIRYGTSANTLSTTITDDRDQVSGDVGQFRTHHVTVRSLEPNTTYYFKIGTGTSQLYDDSGSPYQIKTAGSSSGVPRTVYGEILSPSGLPADGALIYINSDSMSPLSTISQSSGSFVLSLSSARTKSLQSLNAISDDILLSMLVLSPTDTTTSIVTTTIEQSQPVPTITLGVNSDFTSSPNSQVPTSVKEDATQSKFSSDLLSAPATGSGSIASLVISYPSKDGEVMTTTRPQFTGTAPKNTLVSVSIQGPSAQTRTVNTGTQGTWSYTPSTLAKGNYTITVSVTVQGVKQTQMRSFSVNATPVISKAATPFPRVAAASTESAEVSNPSTASGELVAGSLEYTIGLVMISGFLVLTGTYLYYQGKES